MGVRSVIHKRYKISLDCANYSTDDTPHLNTIKSLAGEFVTVLDCDNNGTPDGAAYKVVSDSGVECWAWKRELVK